VESGYCLSRYVDYDLVARSLSSLENRLQNRTLQKQSRHSARRSIRARKRAIKAFLFNRNPNYFQKDRS